MGYGIDFGGKSWGCAVRASLFDVRNRYLHEGFIDNPAQCQKDQIRRWGFYILAALRGGAGLKRHEAWGNASGTR